MNEKPSFLKRFRKGKEPETPAALTLVEVTTAKGEVRPLDFPPNDPLLAYITGSQDVIEVDKLNLDSPTLRALREEGARLALPLVSQDELIGLINLGPRMSEQEYSSDDYRLLHHAGGSPRPMERGKKHLEKCRDSVGVVYASGDCEEGVWEEVSSDQMPFG